MITSPFFEKEKILENGVGFVVYDGFPVSEGHCLIVPHRVYLDNFDSTDEKIIGLQNLVVHPKKIMFEKLDQMVRNFQYKYDRSTKDNKI